MATLHQEMKREHRQWLRDEALWREELGLWQRDLERLKRDATTLEFDVDEFSSELDAFATSLQRHRIALAAHEHALAEFERAGGRMGQVTTLHQLYAERQARQQEFHDRVMVRRLSLMSGRGNGYGAKCDDAIALRPARATTVVS